MFERIERLKAEWTDKYVVIASPAPELARFASATGFVRTVNMNGRCLVEFDQYNNVGWYDIDPAVLKVVPKPLPKPAEAKPAKAAPTPKPAAKAAPAAGATKASTADILAAARAKGAASAAKPAAGKLSTAEILAQARAAKAAAAPPAAVAEPAPEPEEPAVAPAAKPSAKPAGGPLPTTTADKIAWCRAHDAKG